MNGVTPVRARVHWTVGFHPKNLCCGGCTFYTTDPANRDRKRCQITTEIIYEPRAFGMMCPLEFESSNSCEEEDNGSEISLPEG